MITSTVHSCRFCNSENTIVCDFTYGQIACTNCGVVVDDRIIDETSEWRNFSSENTGNGSTDHNRVGGPLNPYLDEVTLSTKIHTKNNKGPLAKFKHRAFESGNRSIQRGLDKIEELAIKLDLLMAIVEKSKDVYKNVIDNKKLKGRSLEGISAAILYHVCRQNNANRSLQDIVSKLKLEKKEFVRCFKSIEPLISSEYDRGNIENTVGLTHVYCNKLDIDIKIRTAAEEITKEVCEKEYLAGRNPSTVAGACIMFTLNLFNEQYERKDLSKVSQIGESTIQNAYQIIKNNKEDITPQLYKDRLVNIQ